MSQYNVAKFDVRRFHCEAPGTICLNICEASKELIIINVAKAIVISSILFNFSPLLKFESYKHKL
jgi:hypothetical protein